MSKDSCINVILVVSSLALVVGLILGSVLSQHEARSSSEQDGIVDTLYFPQPCMMTVDTCGSYRITPRDTREAVPLNEGTESSTTRLVDTVRHYSDSFSDFLNQYPCPEQIHLEWLWIRDIDWELVQMLDLPCVPFGCGGELDHRWELRTVDWELGTMAFGNVKVVSKDTSTVGLYRLVRIVEP